jgi:hypothetical protein
MDIGFVSMPKHYSRRVIFFVCTVAFLVPIGMGQKAPPPTKLETQVLNNAVQGIRTDFSKTRPAKERTIRSAFIESFLTGEYKGKKPNRLGFEIDHAIFEGDLNLRSVTVPAEVRWRDCEFTKGVDLSSAHFFAPLDLSGSKFDEKGPAAINFNGLQVDGNLDLSNIKVEGGAQFYHLEVKGDLFASGDKFDKANVMVQFGQAKVAGKMFFGKLTRDNIDYQPASFAGSLSLADITTLGLDLSSVEVADELDLNHANVQTVLQFNRVECLENNSARGWCRPQDVKLEGLTYKELGGGDVGENLQNLVNHAPYSARSYTQLEDYYRTHANPDRADSVFFDMKAQERKHLSRSRWFWSWVLRILIGYGRSPENALYASGVVVLIGALVFWNRRNLVLLDPEHSPHDYSPLWYSFDLLTPFIDLHQADTWVPRQGWWFGRNYAHLHRILGWILVPIGIAAITGIIK